MTITIIILAALLSTLLCVYIAYKISKVKQISFITFLKTSLIIDNRYKLDKLLVSMQWIIILCLLATFIIYYIHINNTFLHFKY